MNFGLVFSEDFFGGDGEARDEIPHIECAVDFDGAHRLTGRIYVDAFGFRNSYLKGTVAEN